MPDIPSSVLMYGTETPLPERVPLRAGPLAVDFEAGDLRYIRHGGTELIRRIYVAVRDRNWDTITPTLSGLAVHSRADSFEITFNVTHQERDVHFTWLGTVAGSADGVITYKMDGRAVSTFMRNRIGICVLHPASAAGTTADVEHVDGKSTHGAFPREISPHQPFFDIASITHEAAPGVRARVEFSGETFEMEDQRNWTDGSFKTYSTPLRQKFPAEIAAGTSIRHSVRLQLLLSAVAQASGPLQSATRSGQPEELPAIAITSDRAALPGLGLSVASPAGPLTPSETALLKALNLDHLRAEIDLTRPGWQSAALSAHEQADAVGASVQLDVIINDAADSQLDALAAFIGARSGILPEWRTFFLHHTGEKATSSRWVELARQKLGRFAPSSRFGGGTRSYFTELNRNRPGPPLPPWATWSINPQVHAFDNSSLVETLAVQSETVSSARAFLGASTRLAVGPITLRPRFNPNATAAAALPPAGGLPADVDPRQMSLFAAGWTLGSIKYLAGSGAATATYFETVGQRGILASGAGEPHPRFPAAPGSAYPVYHLLAAIAPYRSAPDVSRNGSGHGIQPGGLRTGAAPSVRVTHSSQPLVAEALALDDGSGGLRTLIANLTPLRQRISVTGLLAATDKRGHAEAGGGATSAALLILSSANCMEAMTAPERFRARRGDALHIRGGMLEVTLPPYALARLDQHA